MAGRQACETVRRSKRFPKLIELVLTIGNYMNSSAKAYEPIYGFDMSFLPKVRQCVFYATRLIDGSLSLCQLHSTKANDGKRTLLHFILQEIEKDHSDLLKFGDEFQGVSEMASKSMFSTCEVLERCPCAILVDPNELQRTLNEIKSRITIAQTDLDNAKNAPSDATPGDRFSAVMEVMDSVSLAFEPSFFPRASSKGLEMIARGSKR